MPLTLDQYADNLDTRQDLAWPAPPDVEKPKAKPYLVRLPGIRAVTWNVYGTLLTLAGGELYLEHPQKFIMDVALDKTIQEFKMWKSMTRKPGQPADYMRLIYKNVLDEQRFVAGPPGEKYPEILTDKVWLAIFKKLLQNEYTFNAGFYGSLDDYSRKVAYFFHASLQGTACYEGTLQALTYVQETLGVQGLVADAQCFTTVQLARGLRVQGHGGPLESLIPADLRALSWEVVGKRPSERLFKVMLAKLAERDIEPGEVLHVGNSIEQDVAPARKLGMRAALFAGDKASLRGTPDQLRQPATRPDVLLTSPDQITEVIG
jgi:FMN phosphatase YigB (HAD superfamily)